MYSDIATEVQNELDPDEVLLWSGQPARGIRFRASDIFVVPFSLLWCGFACFWEASVVSHGIGFFTLWGIPFVLVGNYMVWGRFLVDAWERRQSYYAVTNQRILIISKLFSRKVKSLNLRTLSDVTMDEKSNGSGTLTFGPTPPYSNYYKATWPGSSQQTPNFDQIPNVKTVYKIIQDAQRTI